MPKKLVVMLSLLCACSLAWGAEADFEQTKKRAEAGDAKAQGELAMMYYTGKGVPQDKTEAVKWFRLVNDQARAKAQQVRLGFAYRDGKGVLQDDKEAIKWCRKAADRGDARAQYNLGFMYDDGKGMPQDDKEAVKWYRKAADQGHAKAQFNLGCMYDAGEGVPEDYVQSYAWFNLAVANGIADAKQVKDDIAKKMTPEQIARAQELSTELHKKINAAK
jgi:TPR repeat protein